MSRHSVKYEHGLVTAGNAGHHLGHRAQAGHLLTQAAGSGSPTGGCPHAAVAGAGRLAAGLIAIAFVIPPLPEASAEPVDRVQQQATVAREVLTVGREPPAEHRDGAEVVRAEVLFDELAHEAAGAQRRCAPCTSSSANR